LIEQKSDINRKTQSSRTSLHLACERGYINMVKLLLHMGADYTLTNFSKYGAVTTRETPRDVAQDYKFYDIVALLDKYDAHVKKKAQEAAEKAVLEAAEKAALETAEKVALEIAEKEALETGEKSKWECGVCTFENATSSTSCEMCGSEKPNDTQKINNRIKKKKKKKEKRKED